jgi:predicted acetyltransferase
MARMAQSVELVRPSALFRDSYRGLVAEFTEASEKLIPFTLAFEHIDFEALLRRLDACAQGIEVSKGFVAHSTHWLVRNQTDVVGVSNIRHTLTAALRRGAATLDLGSGPVRDGRALAT